MQVELRTYNAKKTRAMMNPKHDFCTIKSKMRRSNQSVGEKNHAQLIYD
jgi:hypothetical protein